MPCYNERTLILIESETWPSMHSNTFHLALAPVDHDQEIAALSLYHVFEQITDRRQPRGKRYSPALSPHGRVGARYDIRSASAP